MPVIAGRMIWANWASTPDPMPMHFDAAGHVNLWGTKSVGVFWRMLALVMSLNVFFLANAWLNKTRTADSVSGGAEGNEGSRRRNISHLLLVTLFFVNAVFAMVGLAVAYLIAPMVILWTVLPGPIGIVVFSIWISNRLSEERLQSEAAVDGIGDEFWYLGMFHADRDDASVSVEPRVGIGYTLNFGRPVAWLLLVVILLPAVLVMFRF